MAELRVTQVGVYVEIEPGQSTSVIYGEVDITRYVSSYRLEASIEQWDAMSFASTAREHGSGVPKWRLPMKGFWTPEFDDAFMTDAVTPPITPKTVHVYFRHRWTNRYVRYTFINGGVIQRVKVGSSATGAIEHDTELVLSGTPTRTVG